MSTRRLARFTAVLLSGSLILAACGGTASPDSSGSRTRNAGLAVSNVVLKPSVVSISAGTLHSIVLDDAGNAYAFGDNEFGQASIPALKDGASKFTAFSAGTLHSILLDDVGNVYAFGHDDYSQLDVPALKSGASTFTAVSAGGLHSLLLDDLGNV